jgi:hypothetical protein
MLPLKQHTTGANPRLDDSLGRSALLEACYHGHDAIIDTLKSAGASLTPRTASRSDSTQGRRLNTSGSSRSNISGVSGGGQRQVDYAAAGQFGSLSGAPASGSDGDSDDAEGTADDAGAGASWSLQLASLLCNCVYECNLPVGVCVRQGGKACGGRLCACAVCVCVCTSAVLTCCCLPAGSPCPHSC